MRQAEAKVHVIALPSSPPEQFNEWWQSQTTVKMVILILTKYYHADSTKVLESSLWSAYNSLKHSPTFITLHLTRLVLSILPVLHRPQSWCGHLSATPIDQTFTQSLIQSDTPGMSALSPCTQPRPTQSPSWVLSVNHAVKGFLVQGHKKPLHA
ncbi:hypothetical protein PAMA_014097 [Pampus argenteus]